MIKALPSLSSLNTTAQNYLVPPTIFHLLSILSCFIFVLSTPSLSCFLSYLCWFSFSTLLSVLPSCSICSPFAVHSIYYLPCRYSILSLLHSSFTSYSFRSYIQPFLFLFSLYITFRSSLHPVSISHLILFPFIPYP